VPQACFSTFRLFLISPIHLRRIRRCPTLPKPQEENFGRRLEEFTNWNITMHSVVKDLAYNLSKTTMELDQFRDGDMRHLLSKDTVDMDMAHINNILRLGDELKTKLKLLKQLEDRLEKPNGAAVSPSLYTLISSNFSTDGQNDSPQGLPDHAIDAKHRPDGLCEPPQSSFCVPQVPLSNQFCLILQVLYPLPLVIAAFSMPQEAFPFSKTPQNFVLMVILGMIPSYLLARPPQFAATCLHSIRQFMKVSWVAGATSTAPQGTTQTPVARPAQPHDSRGVMMQLVSWFPFLLHLRFWLARGPIEGDSDGISPV